MLTTLDAVKANLGLVDKGQDDELLQSIIDGVSSDIEKSLNRTIAATDYVETRHGTGKTEMMAQQFPILSVASVSVNGVTIPARVGTSGSGFVFDDDTIYLEGRCFDRGARNVVLAYRAGFDEVPDGLARCATEIVSFLYREKDRIGLSTKGMQGGETTTYLRDIPTHLTNRLNNWRSVVSPA